MENVLEPFQVTNPIIIKSTKRVQGKKVRQFSPEWYSNHPWLVLCTTKLKALCSYCRYSNHNQLRTEKCVGGGDAFYTNGFNNWKKARECFLQHERSSIHKEAVLKINLMKQPSVAAQLSDQMNRDQKFHREMLLRQLSSLKYLLRQGLAIRGHTEQESNLIQLLLLRCEDCPSMRRWIASKKYLSNEIINELIAVMGKNVLREILQDIREAKCFSSLADEATDMSNAEQLCINIQWVDYELNIYEAPLELIHVPKMDSSITTLIKDSLIRFNLPLAQCKGQAYDGASSMSGYINGVAANIQKAEPSALYVHCLAHCTNLCLQTAGRQIGCIRDALDLVMELSKLIRLSPKRSHLFQSMQLQLSPSSPSLKPLCPTRWTVRTTAIHSVLANYQLLCELLAQVNEGRDEYAMKAGGYLNQMEKFSCLFGLKLSHLVFAATEQLSLTIQGKDTTIAEAVQASKLTLQFLERQRNDDAFDLFYTGVVKTSSGLTSEPALPRYSKRPRRVDDGQISHRFENPQAYFRQQYFETIDLIHEEIQHRFQQTRGMPIAALLETFLLDSTNGALSDVSADKTREKLELYSRDVDITRLMIQIQMLPDILKTYNEKNPAVAVKKVTNLRTLCDIMNEISSAKSLFSEVFTLLRVILTIPVTTATAERTFSCLRRLKTYLRSTMSQTRLNHCMLLHVHKERTDKLDILQVAREFVSANERRQVFFGNFTS